MDPDQLRIENQKIIWIRRSFWSDLAGKILLPSAIFYLAVVTYITNSDQTERRLKMDEKEKELILKQSEIDLGLRQGNALLARDTFIASLINQHWQQIISQETTADRRMAALADTVFSQASDRDSFLLKTRALRTTFSASNGIHNTHPVINFESASSALTGYIQAGKLAARQGDFRTATDRLLVAVRISPEIPRAWNYLAYSQLRLGQIDSAFQSISRAISLNPDDAQLKAIVALNATKILCSSGNIGGGKTYFLAAQKVIPSINGSASKDTELKRLCQL